MLMKLCQIDTYLPNFFLDRLPSTSIAHNIVWRAIGKIISRSKGLDPLIWSLLSVVSALNSVGGTRYKTGQVLPHSGPLRCPNDLIYDPTQQSYSHRSSQLQAYCPFILLLLLLLHKIIVASEEPIADAVQLQPTSPTFSLLGHWQELTSMLLTCCSLCRVHKELRKCQVWTLTSGNWVKLVEYKFMCKM